MDLRQLNTFIQVADLGSLSKAASRLRIAQPALSRQVRLLEEELNVTLFTRHGRGMELTPAGETLRARAGSILRQVEETRADLMREDGVVRGHVVFGVTPTVGGGLVAPLIDRFLASYPEVTLRVVQAYSGFLLDWLQSGELDIALIYGDARAAGVRQFPLLATDLYFVASADTALSPHHAISFAEVARERLVLPGPAHGLRRLVEAEARALGLTLRVTVEADDLQLLMDLTRRHLGATVLPLAAVHSEVTAGRLRVARIIEPHLSRNLVVAKPLGRQNSNATARFTQALRAEVAEMVETGVWSGQLLTWDNTKSR